MTLSDMLLPALSFLVIIVVTWVTAYVLGAIVSRLMSRSTPLVAAQAKRLVWAFVWFVGLLLAVEQLGLHVELLLLIVGLMGAAVIVGNRDSLENISARYFTDLYVPIKVGDYVAVRGQTGRVIEMNPICTIILSADDQLISIPNTVFVKEAVVNATPQAWKELTIPIMVGGDVDLAELERSVLKSCNKIRIHLDQRFPPVLSVKSRTPQSAELTLTLMVKEPGRKEAISAEMNQRISAILESAKKKGQP
ncbi:MAG TPA: mechanosensitive ion channel family protein [Conexivisphaerales archaeon]|nr:mechanosensitive ion channel family protein [Conexivisphaerales archaeon]